MLRLHQENRYFPKQDDRQTLHSVHIIYITCETKCVVYLIKCKRCQMQYIGMITRALYFHCLPLPIHSIYSAGDNKLSIMGGTCTHHLSDDMWLVQWQQDNNNNNNKKAGVARPCCGHAKNGPIWLVFPNPPTRRNLYDLGERQLCT